MIDNITKFCGFLWILEFTKFCKFFVICEFFHILKKTDKNGHIHQITIYTEIVQFPINALNKCTEVLTACNPCLQNFLLNLLKNLILFSNTKHGVL